MIQAFKLAIRNLTGAGVRTWLNIIALALVLFLMIFFNGLMDGWNNQAKRDAVSWSYGNGQLWHKDLDLLDSFTYNDAYGHLPEDKTQGLTPILIRPVTLYPQGRLFSGRVNGIPWNQKGLSLPTSKLCPDSTVNMIPVVIGKRMAGDLQVKEGDELVMRWRDVNGMYDAVNVYVAQIFNTYMLSIDAGQIWMDLSQLQKLCSMENEVSYYVIDPGYDKSVSGDSEWIFKSPEFLLKPFDIMVKTARIGSSVLFLLFFLVGLLAIFDTQLLSVYRRQKEIGTYIALGMTRQKVQLMFTLEGFMYSSFAVILTLVAGMPIFLHTANIGFTIPLETENLGVMLPNVIYPEFSFGLILSTSLLMIIFSTLVSVVPVGKIAGMNPVQALKGKAL